MPPAISIRDLTVRYGAITAVQKCDLEISEGEIFGLLGPNGAGKSSIMRVITGLIRPSEGTIKLWNKEVIPTSYDFKKLIGIVPQEYSFASDFTVFENLKFFSKLYDYYGTDLNKVVERQLSHFQLRGVAEKGAGDLSGGYKRLLNFALSTIHSPRLLLLDEPTVGLDPDMRAKIWEIIKEYKNAGTTLVLTTHYLEEATYLCDRLAIIYKGKILVIGSPQDLISQYGGETKIFLQLSNPAAKLLDDAKKIKEIQNVTANEDMLVVSCTNQNVAKVISVIYKLILDADISVKDSYVKEATLDDVFKAIVGSELGVK